MSMKSFLPVVAVLFAVAPAGAKIACAPLHCPTSGPVEAARAIIERDCPCAAQPSAKAFRRCAKRAIKTARQEIGAALTSDCLMDVKAAMKDVTCGRPGTVACNKRNKRDTRTTCAVVRATKCTGSACGAFTSCLDACNPSAQACVAPTSTTTTTIGSGGSTSTTLGGGGTTTTSTTLGSGGTTTTTSTTLGGGATTTTSTTLPGYSCSITTAECLETACMCGPSSGIDYHPGASGTVSGPVGTLLNVNSFPSQGGTMDCGGWTRVFGNPYGSTTVNCDLFTCCLHETGAPDTVTWAVYEMADLPCYCPSAPAPILHNYVAQCQLPPNPVLEAYKTSGPCP
jgi:hypothetical protein